MKVAYVWTDGSCHNASKSKGGYGIFIRYVVNDEPTEEVKISGGSYYNTTSARMEVLAILEAIKYCSNDCDLIVVHSDNQYAVNTIDKGWIFKWEDQKWKERKNADLWKQMLIVCRAKKAIIKLKWVKGHNDLLENELADALATQGANSAITTKDK